MFEEKRRAYERMRDFVKSLGADRFIFKYEGTTANWFDGLNGHLEFIVKTEAGVPKGLSEEKVVRGKATAGWRHWFVQEEVELLKQAHQPYIEVIGCGVNDLGISPSLEIEPRFSSVYMRGLPRRVTPNIVLR